MRQSVNSEGKDFLKILLRFRFPSTSKIMPRGNNPAATAIVTTTPSSNSPSRPILEDEEELRDDVEQHLQVIPLMRPLIPQVPAPTLNH
jgi:hypothetical protein